MAKRGRPIALTPEKAERIIEALSAGAPIRVAAAAGGISQDALAGYRDPKSPTYLPEFAERVTCARDHGASELIETVKTAAKTDWRAARFLLGVMLPDTYGNRVMVSGAPGASPIHIEGDLRIAGDIRANVKASGKLHEAILDAAKTKR